MAMSFALRQMISEWVRLTFTSLWASSFIFFYQKIDFNISCKLTLNAKANFLEKIRNIFQNAVCEIFTQHAKC